MKLLPPLVIALIAFGVWHSQRGTTARLEAQADALRIERRDADALRRERDRLRQLQADATESAALRRDAAEARQLKQESSVRQATKPLPAEGFFPTAWTPAANWGNRGRGDPAATMETTLWAAAGGDIAALQSVLLLDATTRTRADALFARLPERARTLYGSVEQLIAAFTAKAIPLGEAQLVWQQQTSPDDANVCVFLRHRGSATPAAATPNAPPALADGDSSSSAYLSLRRGPDGWRLVVPPNAVEKIAKELGIKTREGF